MERLTLSDYGRFKILPPAGTKEKERPSYMDLYCRLVTIEDILGDEYDLDWLQVIMDAEQHGGLIVGYGPGDPGEPGELGVMEEVAADYVVVVRCRECRHSSLPSGFTQRYGEPGTLSCHFGPCNRRNVNENDFCSYGQRKIETVLPKSDAENESLEADHEVS